MKNKNIFFLCSMGMLICIVYATEFMNTWGIVMVIPNTIIFMIGFLVLEYDELKKEKRTKKTK